MNRTFACLVCSPFVKGQGFVPRSGILLSPIKVMQAMKVLKIKNCEGSNRIPQRILADGIEILHLPFARLFELIYTKPDGQLIIQIRLDLI